MIHFWNFALQMDGRTDIEVNSEDTLVTMGV